MKLWTKIEWTIVVFLCLVWFAAGILVGKTVEIRRADARVLTIKQEAITLGYATFLTDGDKIAFFWNDPENEETTK